MSDEKNKRLLKNIFGYYPVFDPETMKKIPPKTPEEKIDSHFSYLDDEKRNSIKAMISDPEKVLERAKNLEKIIIIKVKHTGKGEGKERISPTNCTNLHKTEKQRKRRAFSHKWKERFASELHKFTQNRSAKKKKEYLPQMAQISAKLFKENYLS